MHKNQLKKLSKPDFFWVEETQSIIKVSNRTEKGFSHALKLHFSKKKVPLPFEHQHVCAFCGKPNQTWYFKTSLSGKQINILGIGYLKPIDFCYSTNSSCPGKKLNPNSVEFVSTTRRINKSDAIKLIHNRNSSPFYKENHADEAQYKKFQGTRISSKDENEIRKIIEKQNFSRSLAGYIARFGEEAGRERWNNIQQQKAITTKNLERIYGKNAQEMVNLWKSKVGPSLENFIRRYGEVDGLAKYRAFHEKTRKSKTNAFGTVTSKDGHTLRSNYERLFFDALIQENVDASRFSTDGYYPNSVLRYDFFFPEINIYVEIAGMTDPAYLNKLETKIKKFDPIVVFSNDFISGRYLDTVKLIKEKLNDN